MPPDAYPKIEQCAANQPLPQFPENWTATTLLTPFDGSELQIAEVFAIMQGQSQVVAPFCADCHGGEIGK